MTSYLRRLLRTGAAYQLADAVSKVVALALLPVYTRHLTPADYGTAELMLTTIILASIVLRLGLGEAFVRFHYLDADPERRRRLARTATGTLSLVTTVAAVAVALAAEPVSRALLGTPSRTSSAPPRSACGRSRTSSSRTRCCGWRSARGRSRPRRWPTWR